MDKPEADKVYALTGGHGDKCIANGNTWAESEVKGKRLKDIIFDRHEDFLYEDSRAMKLTPYVMSERCLQVEAWGIFKDAHDNDYSTLTYILEGGFKGFHNMDSSELIKEYKDIEDKWYELEADNELNWEPYEEDPIHKLKEEA